MKLCWMTTFTAVLAASSKVNPASISNCMLEPCLARAKQGLFLSAVDVRASQSPGAFAAGPPPARCGGVDAGALPAVPDTAARASRRRHRAISQSFQVSSKSVPSASPSPPGKNFAKGFPRNAFERSGTTGCGL